MKKFEVLDRIIIFGLYVFAFSSAWSITVMQIGYFSALAAWLVKIAIKREWELKKTPLNIALLLFVAATVFASVVGVNFSNSIKGLPKTLGWMLMFFLAASEVKETSVRYRLISILVLSGFLESLYGIYQFFFQKSKIDGRVFGSTGHAIFLGEILVVVLSFTIARLLTAKLNIFKITFYLFMVIAMVICLLLTLSRGPWIAFLTSIIFFVVAYPKRILIPLLVIGVILYLGVISFQETTPLLKRLDTIMNVSHENNKERIAMWNEGLRLIPKYPLGVGVHNMDKVVAPYKFGSGMEVTWTSLHSNVLQIAVERGLLGLITFILWISLFLLGCTKSFRLMTSMENKSVLAGCLAGFLGFIVSGITEYNYGTSQVIMLIWFVMGVGVSAWKSD